MTNYCAPPGVVTVGVVRERGDAVRRGRDRRRCRERGEDGKWISERRGGRGT